MMNINKVGNINPSEMFPFVIGISSYVLQISLYYEIP